MKASIRGVALGVTVLLGSMALGVAPTEPAFATPCFTDTNNVVSNGGSCTGVVEIPVGVTEIADKAFENSTLTSISIPASVTRIGEDAFRETTSLTAVTFAPDSTLTEIAVRAFRNSTLTSISIPASVTTIGGNAFQSTSSLTTVTFPPDSTLEQIGIQAFNSSGLTSIEIPASVTSLGDRSFALTASLTTVTFAEGSQLTEIRETTFASSGLESVVIPGSVRNIRNNAFGSSSSLSTVTFLGDAPAVDGPPSAPAFEQIAPGAKAFIGFGATGFDVDNDGLWNLLLVVRAAPPSVAGVSPSSAVPSAVHLDIRFRVGELAANQTVLAEGQGLQPRSAFSLTLRSTPQTLATGTVNSGGLFSTTVSVPSGIPAGFHTITLRAIGSQGELLTLVSGFTVDDRGVVTSVTSNVSSAAAQLAVTGPSHKSLTMGALAGGLALLAGVVLVGARRVVVRGQS